MVGHPAVLTDAGRDGVGTEVEKHVYAGLTVVTYRRTRFYLDRNAWEALGPNDALLMRIRPNNGGGGSRW
jgi:hypothetical protein